MPRKRGVRLKGVKYGRARKDGTRVPYYLRPDGKCVRLPELPENHPEFLAAYARAAEGAHAPLSLRRPRMVSGSLAALENAYVRSAMWQELAPSTQAVRLRILKHILDKSDGRARDVIVSTINTDSIQNDIRGLKPNVAHGRLKVWRGFLDFAVAENWIKKNPAKAVEAPKRPKTQGFIPWSRDEVDQYREHHLIGTDARLAMEVCYWTAAASVDAVRLGWQLVGRDGWLRFSRQKTGTAVEIPCRVLPAWMRAACAEDHAHFLAALGAMPPGRMLWLETQRGRPRSEKAFGSWLADHARAAGLPENRSPHGLRKSRLNRFAEAGWSVPQLMSWAGHLTPDEAILYTEKADRRLVLEGTERDRNSRIPSEPYSENAEKISDIKEA